MTKHRNNNAHGWVHQPRRRFGRAPLLLAALLGALVAGPLLAAPAQAVAVPEAQAAAETSTATATPAPTDEYRTSAPTPEATASATSPAAPPAPPTPTAEPLVPTIDGPASNDLVGGRISVGGSRGPDQEIQLLSPTGGDPICIMKPDGSTSWQCPNVDLPNGPAVTLRAVVTGASDLSATVTVRVLHAPTVTGGSTGQASSNGLVRGTGYPGATVTATLASGQRCSFTVDSSGAWACLIEGGLVSGSEQITASQQTGYSTPRSSPASEPVTLLFDVDAPAAPVVAGLAAGAVLSAGSPFYGRGENGARVTVFVGASSLCSAVVSGGTWSCTGGGVADGGYDLRAVQQDAAGNVSAGSTAIRVRYGVPAPTPAASRPPAAAIPVTPTATPQPGATPVPTAAGGTATATPLPAVPVLPAHTADALPPELIVPGGWNDPTPFSSAVIPPWTVAQFPWLQAVLLTLGALLLLVIPARLLAGTVSRARNNRPVFGRPTLAGRNQARVEFEVAPALRLHRAAVGAAAIGAASVVVLLSGPVTGAPAYLRLFVAVLLALGVVNAVATLVPQWWGSRALQVEVSATFLPRYLLLVAVTALGSRALDLHPALLFGVLGSVVVSHGPVAAQRGQLAAIRAGSLLALGLVALLVVGTLPAADTFLSALAAEFANTIVLAAIGSAVLVLIPIGSTSGRSILAWSPPVWAALAVPSFLTLFVLLSPMLPRWRGDGTGLLIVLPAAVFALLSVAAWAWQRYLAPAPR